ncbi:MAG TPA: DNA alkylation repair protein [bacterium]|nr:DNA alkylation repair protein [bacterium]
MTCAEVVARLESLASDRNREGMGRFGIAVDRALGVPMPELRRLAKEIGSDHDLAGELWETGIHEARLLACLVALPGKLTEEQLERWAAGFDSWDLVDQCCSNLVDRTPFAWAKVREWAGREEEFVRRAAFALLAALAVHDKKSPDGRFLDLLPLIEGASDDGRNYVKKAVNWALRQIGKRNLSLNAAAVKTAEEISKRDSKAARWIAADALRELSSAKLLDRLRDKARRAGRSR